MSISLIFLLCLHDTIGASGEKNCQFAFFVLHKGMSLFHYLSFLLPFQFVLFSVPPFIKTHVICIKNYSKTLFIVH